MQSAGVTLVKRDLAGIARARTLSRMTMRNIWQNLVFAFTYNPIGIPGAAPCCPPAGARDRNPRLNSVQAFGPAARGGVVRRREIEAEHADDGADQPLGLAQRQARNIARRVSAVAIARAE